MPKAILNVTPVEKQKKIKVTNTGDRPIQVGSHYHFFEANKALSFNRTEAFGMRLDVPAGNAVRFEPGEEKEVTIISYSGLKRAFGFNDLVNGDTSLEVNLEAAKHKLKLLNFKH